MPGPGENNGHQDEADAHEGIDAVHAPAIGRVVRVLNVERIPLASGHDFTVGTGETGGQLICWARCSCGASTGFFEPDMVPMIVAQHARTSIEPEKSEHLSPMLTEEAMTAGLLAAIEGWRDTETLIRNAFAAFLAAQDRDTLATLLVDMFASAWGDPDETAHDVLDLLLGEAQ